MYEVSENKRKPNLPKSVRFRSINVTKAVAMICTVYAILGVDFPSIFPRAMAKTEEYGLSVMDFGVAYVTINSGYASRYARPWLVDRLPLWKELYITLRSTIVPMALGFARFYLLDTIEYQKHASEYGVHWNFYTTVACTSIMLCFLRDSKYAMFVALAIMIVYEFCL